MRRGDRITGMRNKSLEFPPSASFSLVTLSAWISPRRAPWEIPQFDYNGPPGIRHFSPFYLVTPCQSENSRRLSRGMYSISSLCICELMSRGCETSRIPVHRDVWLVRFGSCPVVFLIIELQFDAMYMG